MMHTSTATLNTLKLRVSLLIYCGVILLVMLKIPLCPDAYYYWQWSKHLALSYYDGPPLIAYTIKLFTTVFGQHETSLYLINIATMLITSITIWRIALLKFDSNVGLTAVLIWILTAGIDRYFGFQTTYNAPLIAFWGLSLYCFLQLQQTKATKYYYYLALCLGNALLAKYTAVLLCASFFIICLFYKPFRFILQNKHFYIGLGLLLLVFSPVIVWNYQHNWASFIYQLNHGYHAIQSNPIAQIKAYFIATLMDYNLGFLLLILAFIKYNTSLFKEERWVSFTIPTVFVFLFFLLSSNFATAVTNWSAPFYFTAVFLIAYLITEQNWHFVLRLCCYTILAIPSILYVAGLYSFAFYVGNNPEKIRFAAARHLIPQLTPTLGSNRIIFTSDYILGSFLASFLPNNPTIYAVDRDQGKQFYFWYQEAHPQLTQYWYITLLPVDAPKPKLAGCTIKKALRYQEMIGRKNDNDMVWLMYLSACTLNS